MTKLVEICAALEAYAPLRLAEDWDNVGLLVGDRQTNVKSVMTCLTVTPASVDEAVAEGCDLIVTHHPLPFRPLQKITSDTTPGRLLLRLIRNGVCVYSPHTAFDSAAAGINQRLADALALGGTTALLPASDDPEQLGAGRVGQFDKPIAIDVCAARLKRFLTLETIRLVGNPKRNVAKVAIGCGSGGQFLASAIRDGCDLMVTGEAQFHTCLEAEANDIGLMLLGHFASERFAVEALAKVLTEQFPGLRCWACRDEQDPISVL